MELKRIAATCTIILSVCSAHILHAGVELINAFPNLSFASPLDLKQPGDGTHRLFCVEKAGQIWVFQNDPTVTSRTLFLDITSKVQNDATEEGLLGLAFHPAFPDSPYVYVNYTAPSPRHTMVERYTVSTDPDVANPGSALSIIEYNQPAGNHNGGNLVFGPDGYLYIGTGDGGSSSSTAQDLTSVLGSMLRIDVDGTSSGGNYAIPPDNPLVGNGSGYREEIWAWGFRNPWRYSFDTTTGALWVGDVGQDTWEEIDIAEASHNYGWPEMEGFHCYPSPPCDSTGLTSPLKEYLHYPGRAITGGYVYRGAWIPELVGRYIYGDYVSGEIWALAFDSTGVVSNVTLVDTPYLISSFGVDEHGELFVCSLANGVIYRLSPVITGAGGDVPEPRGTLEQNHPNPFNPLTTIAYTVFGRARVAIDIFEVSGRQVTTLVDRSVPPGRRTVEWDGRDANGHPQASGVYFYRLTVGGVVVETKRMVLLK